MRSTVFAVACLLAWSPAAEAGRCVVIVRTPSRPPAIHRPPEATRVRTDTPKRIESRAVRK